MKYRIFIVEDDGVIAAEVKKHLESWDFRVSAVSDFQNVLGEFGSASPHLVLLDISLPFFNGYHWCSEIRKISKVPVIFLSSASDGMNLVMAINMGADDFITKPFELSVLTAKIQALLRRTYDFGQVANILECGGAVLNTDECALYIGGSRAELTKNEYRILQLLMENRGRVVSRDSLIERLWESDSFIGENTLTVNMARLRKKLEGYGLTDFIRTKKGSGYIVG